MGRNIIVLSDGTGNSAAKLAKTNVWRTYQAIDFSAGDQLAMYDDGVGTSTFKPLAILGGAVGWGLKRNVLGLYKFLCRNYRAGDRLYGFGFSRGAFTIRVLTGLVLNQGLVRAHSEEELDYLAESAYRHYRRERYHGSRFSLARIGRLVRDAWIAARDRLYGSEPYTPARNQKVERIEFLGLWDTVDAYGMPVRELKTAIHKYLWPLYFDNLKLSDRVAKACHALALDDERATFHPLVWDESDEPGQPDARQRRVEQVWFAGVHSNVGGGYPDDALSHVSLLWILERARDAQLKLKAPVVDEYRRGANPFGRIYDSRGGVSSYYRYAPRRVDSYPHAPVIDPSVQRRIEHGSDQYAPISLPAPRGREADAERVWDTVWWRRVAYWLMLAFTALLVFLAWKERPVPRTDEYVRDAVGMLLDLVAPFAPSFLDGWIGNLRDSPTWVAVLLTAIVATYWLGRFLERRIHDRSARIWRAAHAAERRKRLRQGERRWQAWTSGLLFAAAFFFALWLALGRPALAAYAAAAAAAAVLCWLGNLWTVRKLKAGHEEEAEPRGVALSLAHALRTSGPLAWAWRFLANRLIPAAFALLVLALAVHALNRASFAVLNVAGAVCEPSDDATAMRLGEERRVAFATWDGCWPTGVIIERDALYQVEVLQEPPWLDGAIPVPTLAGFSSSDDYAPWYMWAFVPMRRHLAERWFKPIAHVGGNSLSDHVLAAKAELRDATRSGELFVFVNDAIIGLPGWWDRFYFSNNEGTGTLVIRKIRDAGEGT